MLLLAAVLALSCAAAPRSALAPQAEAALQSPPVLDHFLGAICAWIDEQPGADLETLRGDLDAEMTRLLSKSQIVGVLKPLRDAGAVRTTLVEQKGPERGITTWIWLLEQDKSLWSTEIAIDASGKVCGWWVRPAPRHLARRELLAGLAGLEGDWGLAVAAFDAQGRELQRVEIGSGPALLPLGSIFKLYVLAELARQVSEGKVDLTRELEIREELKSVPSGKMQDLPAGTRVAVAEMAREMIRISDNTATDHLLDLVGRANVEAHLGEYGNSAPERNRPFLSTREMFTLKGLAAGDYEIVFEAKSLEGAAGLWAKATPDQRASWLAGAERQLASYAPDRRRERVATAYGFNSVAAKSHAEIEWLARPADVVALVAAAHRGALISPEASRVFLEFYGAGAPLYTLGGVAAQGFKGGSETAVLALSSRVVLRDGRAVIGCICRARFNVFDAKLPIETQGLFTAWMRNLLEGDPPAPAKGDGAGR